MQTINRISEISKPTLPREALAAVRACLRAIARGNVELAGQFGKLAAHETRRAALSRERLANG